MDYLPHFFDNLGNRWEVLSMNFCVDWGGRQCQIECQRNNNDGVWPTKAFVIHYLGQSFKQWDSTELVDCSPCKDTFYKLVINMFKEFDE